MEVLLCVTSLGGFWRDLYMVLIFGILPYPYDIVGQAFFSFLLPSCFKPGPKHQTGSQQKLVRGLCYKAPAGQTSP